MPILNQLEKWVDTYFAFLPRPQPHISHVANARLIAHRGAHDHAKGIIENTDAAFARALDLGCWGIELDIHATADNILMVNHDPTLQRLWDLGLTLADSDFKTIRAAAPQIPSLEEVVTRYGKQMHLFIELKAPFVAQKELIEVLKPLTPCIDYHLLSLDETIFSTLDLFPKESLLLVPVHNNVNKFCNISLRQHYAGVLGHYFLLRDKQIKQLNAANQIAGVGFVDSKNSLYRELTRGLRYLFSNKVEAVSTYLQELTQ